MRRRECQNAHYGLRKILRCAASKTTLFQNGDITYPTPFDIANKKWSFISKFICVSGQQNHTYRQKRFTNSQYDTNKEGAKADTARLL